MSTLTILKKAKTMIEDPENWWAGLGNDCADGAECAVTAIQNEGNHPGALGLLDQAAKDLFQPDRKKADDATVEGWAAIIVNDTLGHEAVMQMYDRAIELANG